MKRSLYILIPALVLVMVVVVVTVLNIGNTDHEKTATPAAQSEALPATTITTTNQPEASQPQAAATQLYAPAAENQAYPEDTESAFDALDEATLLSLEDPNPDYATFGDRVQEVSARRNGQAMDPRLLWLASQEKEGWSALDDMPVAAELSETERYDGREFIRVNPLKIESLVAGDKMALPISQINQTYTMKVDAVRSESGNSVTWTGHLEGLESDNHVVITRGDSLIVAGITTPEGLFELQARGDEGWIASSATLFKGGDEIIEGPLPPTQSEPASPETSD
jgi:hypothetical protein